MGAEWCLAAGHADEALEVGARALLAPNVNGARGLLFQCVPATLLQTRTWRLTETCWKWFSDSALGGRSLASSACVSSSKGTNWCYI